MPTNLDPSLRPGDKFPEESRTRRSLLGGDAILFLLALVKLLVHLLTAGNYGYFRDELYYIAANERLALGYVDFPPFVAFATALARATLGDSLLALDFLPALAGAAVVVLAGLMARELGGGRFAQGLAALAVLVAPNFLVFGTFISMDAFDQLFWVSAAYILLLILKRNEPRLWPLFGLFAGLGLLTKLTILAFGFAALAGLLLTSARRHLRSPWPWMGGGVAVAFLAPYVYWNATNGWPTPEFWGEYGGKVDEASPVEFSSSRSSPCSRLPCRSGSRGLAFTCLRGKGDRTGLWAGSTSFSSCSSRRSIRGSTSSPQRTRCCSLRGAWRSSGSSGGAVAGAGRCPLTRRYWR
jgi:4-amino-4-deoxy-L-arabinose transferase-like glycosyltransferase